MKSIDMFTELNVTNEHILINENTFYTTLFSIYLPILILFTGTIGNLLCFLIFLSLNKSNNEFFTNSIFIKSIRYIIVLIESIVKAHPETNESSTSCEELNFDKNKQDSTKMRKNVFIYSTGFFSIINYFAILALIDLAVLYTGLLGDIYMNLTLKSFKDYSQFLCKSLTFVGYLSSHLSSAVILLVSFIRFLAIYSPIWAAKLTNSYTIRKLISTLLFIFMMLNLHLFWNMDLVEFDIKEHVIENYNKRFTSSIESDFYLEAFFNDTNINKTKYLKCKLVTSKFIWPIIDKLVYSIIPFILIVIFNTLIIININRAQTYRYLFYAANIKSAEFSQTSLNNIKMVDMKKEDKKTLTTSFNFSNNNRNSRFYQTASNSFSILIKKPCSVKSMASLNKQNGKNKQLSDEIKAKLESLKKNNLIGKRLTFMLLSLSFGFLICTFPITILFVFLEKIQESINEIKDIHESNRALEWLHLAQRISSLLMYLNHSINFFIYFFTSQRFRQQFSRLFKGFKIKCQKNNINEWKRIKHGDIII